MTLLAIAFGVLWWVVGFGGAIYWWTGEFDLEPLDLVPTVMIATAGPLVWIAVWLSAKKPVLVRKRDR